jgi:transposase-like protein
MTIPKFLKSNNGRRYAPEQKLEIVLKNIMGISTIDELSKETGASTKRISDWKKEFFNKAHTVFSGNNGINKSKTNIDSSKVIARQEKEITLLKKLLEHYKKNRTNQFCRSPEDSFRQR